MDYHAGGVSVGKNPRDELRVPGVEALQRLSADPDAKLRRRSPQCYAVVQDPVGGKPDALLDNGHDRWVSPLFHASTVSASGYWPRLKCRSRSVAIGCRARPVLVRNLAALAI